MANGPVPRLLAHQYERAAGPDVEALGHMATRKKALLAGWVLEREDPSCIRVPVLQAI
jgi:hypothetical protein